MDEPLTTSKGQTVRGRHEFTPAPPKDTHDPILPVRLYVQALETFAALGCPHGCADELCPWYRRLRELGLRQ